MTPSNTGKTRVSQATALPAEDEQAVRDLVALAVHSQSDHSVHPDLHTEEVVIVNIVGRRLFGRDTFGTAMKSALDSGLGDIRTTVEIIDIRPITSDVVLVSCIKTIHDERPDAETTLPSTGALTYAAVRTVDGWKLALAQTTAIQ
ncbi:SgcJ/EcaC family oxidoreductase [Nocardia sp. CNY236]|uniref:SgcJ/EcaC family oxidoreductase n=1 Tax=Nocardia sp. CNY236 TaxID=1169152 RepID=UPI000684355A|nr:SgcJ/EcaC family oxidoreductase [Nocardia sp. CNY236]